MRAALSAGRSRRFLLLVLTGCGTSAVLAAVILPTASLTLSFATTVQARSLPGGAELLLPSTTPLPTLPLPTVSVPVSVPSVVPTPSMPAVSPPAVPTPSLPVGVTPSPPLSPSPSPNSSTPAGPATKPGTSGGGSSQGAPPWGDGFPGVGLTVPVLGIVLSSPLDVAVAVTLAVLPLLLGIWLLLAGRTWNEARLARDAGIRVALATDLGLSPREFSSMTTKGLFKLREQAAFDDLTGVLRRAAGISAADREIARARRQKTPLTVAFLDLDGLKQINDGRGHVAGDQLLRGLASGLRGGLRGQDLVLRYGGDEFVCVLPETTAEAATAKLQQIQTELAAAGIGFSMGVAQFERNDDVVSLLGRADGELYKAKARPRIVVHPDDRGRRALA